MPSLSAHLLEDFETRRPQQQQHIVQSGAMEYNLLAHGQRPQQNPAFSQFSQAGILNAYSSDASFSTDDANNMALAGIPQPLPAYQQMLAFQKQREEEQALKTAKSIATLQAKLNQKLGPEYISQRPGPAGGPKLTYAEGWKVINLANEVFGFNGWSSSVVSLTVDYIDYNQDTQRYNVGVTAIVKVCLRDGVSHEDIGYGMLENCKSKGMALDKCKKEAVTDGLKRTLRTFGNVLGNCLYDKEYIKEILKVKAQPPQRLQPEDLHRPKERENATTNAGHTRSHPPLAPPPVPTAISTSMNPDSRSKPPALSPQTAPPPTKLSVPSSSTTGVTNRPLAQPSRENSLYSMSSDDDAMFADISLDELSGFDFADKSHELPPPTSNFDATSRNVAPTTPQTVSVPPKTTSSSTSQPASLEAKPRELRAEPAASGAKRMSTRESILASLAEMDTPSQPLSPSPSLKPRTPSGGGFVIPPGVKRPQRPAFPIENRKSTSGIGTKRPIDAVTSSTSGKVESRFSGGGIPTARNVLAELELSTDGTVKRPRLS